MIFGDVPTKKGALQMTSASRLSPKVHLSLQYLISNFFRIENVVSVSCTLVHYDKDVDPGFHYYEAEGTALNIHDITGSSQSRIIQCPKSTNPQAGIDKDMTRFEELAGALTPDGTAGEASEAEPRHGDGRRSTIYEESKADLESHVVEAWCAKLQGEKELLEATPPEDLFTIPTHMVPHQSALITVADEQRGHLPKWGRTHDSDIEETYDVLMCSMVEDCSYGPESCETGSL
eukprot:3809837-Pyramimonas_sp.AAC.1